MTNAAIPALEPAFSPLDPQRRPLAWKAAAVIIGAAVLALSSYISVPMVPVPITLQTFAVTVIGALYGWRLGALTVIVWLALGAAGAPVLAGGASGAKYFLGATAGYLFAFPLAAALTGWLAEKGWNGRRPGYAFLSMLLGSAVCLAVGAVWLATKVGPEKALMAGVVPFLVGALIKSVLGAVVLRLAAGRAGR
jgi:biotin transport system substrate-specific component